MRASNFLLIASGVLSLTVAASAATRYVDLNNPAPVAPYTSWATAATTIQAAVDAAVAGDEIVVTNGTYASGGRAVYGAMTNRVAIDKAVTVRSVNGPLVTIIEGGAAPGTSNGNGSGAVRCVYVGINAVLSGFTLTNGHTLTTGDSGKERSGGGARSETSSGVITNCALHANSASTYGGGVSGGTLKNCALNSNSAGRGGGASGCKLYNCTLSDNSATEGGGAHGGTLNNCTLSGNSASYCGGGAYSAQLNNCIVYYNLAPNGSNYYGSGSKFNYCCTVPLPSGLGNIDTEPRLASTSHLLAHSPCIGRGSTNYTSGVDIDGERWLDPPCIGADQVIEGQVVGALALAIDATYTNASSGFAVSFTALNEGRIRASVWDFGDGTVVSNRAYASHAWAVPGLYTVRLTGYNDSWPGGVSTTVQVQVADREIYYVDAGNTTPVYPYANWAGAAANIQDAIDVGTQTGRLVLVADGIYKTGGRAVYGTMTNRVAVTEGVEVRSVNGPLVTCIEGQAAPGSTNGDGAIRCVYVGINAVLSGFTLTNGHTQASGDFYKEQSGGGAWCEFSGTLNNCVLNGNSANSYGGGAHSGTLNNCILRGNSASYGGGAYYITLNNCTLSGNSASRSGGGAHSGTLNNCTLGGNLANSNGGGVYGGTLNNCTLSGNSANSDGGGAYSGMLNNCIVYYNSALDGQNYANSTLNYCCATPLPPGPGNIETEPLLASASHLSEQSPCVGRGSSAYSSGLDIDGERWLDPPCIGADQFVQGQATGALVLAIETTYTNVAAGFLASFVALNEGRISASVWDFGDGTVVSNRAYASHAWAAPGLYTVRLTGYNDSWPGGVTTTLRVQVSPREIHYVSAGNVTPVRPYTSWAGAAANIQDAIDAGTQPGRLVLVADGVYKTGGRAVYGTMTNRVVVTDGVEVRSVNGPLVTIIEGETAPGASTGNGNGAIRCAYVGSSAVLSGFTLTNGHTQASGDICKEQSGGGAWCEFSGSLNTCALNGDSAYYYGGGAYSGMLSNCTASGNSACYGGGAYSGTLNNCTLSRNSASSGGGAHSGTLNNCTLSRNSASSGGGAYDGTLNNCTLSGNSATGGGGAHNGTLYNCTLSGNTADNGGGAHFATLNNCTLSGNSASFGGGAYSTLLNNCTLSGNSALNGGGVYSGTLNNCTLSGNSANCDGGGASSATLNNCTLSGNSANFDGGGASSATLSNCTLSGNSASYGGGASGGTLNNCIVYYNISRNGSNYYGSSCKFSYCCTTPLPSGPGNIEGAPGFVDTNGWSNLRLQTNSPCINAGANTYVSTSTDLDGCPRIVGGAVDMGAYEFQSPASTIFYAWLQQYGLSTDGLADLADSDADGFNNWQEWVAGTNPTNSASALRMLAVPPAASTTNGITVGWTSATNRTYCLERALVLGTAPGFGIVRSNISGLNNTTTFTDTNAAGPGPFFYRVRVEN